MSQTIQLEEYPLTVSDKPEDPREWLLGSMWTPELTVSDKPEQGKKEDGRRKLQGCFWEMGEEGWVGGLVGRRSRWESRRR